MAATYFQRPTITIHGQRLDSAVAQIMSGFSDLQEIYDLLTSMKDGTDFTLVESNLGLAAGQGAPLYNMVKGSLDMLAELDAGQPNRLKKLITRVN